MVLHMMFGAVVGNGENTELPYCSDSFSEPSR